MKTDVAAGIVTLVSVVAAAPPARATQDAPPVRPQASSAVSVTVQGGGEGVALEPGAPPPLEPSQETGTARGSTVLPATGPTPAARPASAKTTEPSLRLVAGAEGEATVEVEGQAQVVRPGSSLGEGTVKAVGPDRLVYVRPARSGEPGGEALVIVTFDAAGRSRARVFWSRLPEPPPAEVRRP